MDKDMRAVRNVEEDTAHVGDMDNQEGVGNTGREDKDGVVEGVLTSWVYELAMVWTAP